MPHLVTSVKRTSSSPSANYSHCPLKKRPIKYDPVDDSDSDVSYKGNYFYTFNIEKYEFGK